MGCIFSTSQDSDRPAACQLHDAILGKAYEDGKLHYTIGKELDNGEFGITFLIVFVLRIQPVCSLLASLFLKENW